MAPLETCGNTTVAGDTEAGQSATVEAEDPVPVIPEDAIVKLLRTCLDLSGRALDQFPSGAASPASSDLLEDYSALIRELHDHKKNDSTLADETWEWIWEVNQRMNPIQIYGRLAWINYTLLDLL